MVLLIWERPGKFFSSWFCFTLSMARGLGSHHLLQPFFLHQAETPEQEERYLHPRRHLGLKTKPTSFRGRHGTNPPRRVNAALTEPCVICYRKRSQSVFGNQAYQNKSLFLRNWNCFLIRRLFLLLSACFWKQMFGNQPLPDSQHGKIQATSQICWLAGAEAGPPSTGPVLWAMSQNMRIPDVHFHRPSLMLQLIFKKSYIYSHFTVVQGQPCRHLLV